MTENTGNKPAPPGIVPAQIDIENGHILHDRALVPPPGPEFFEAEHWRAVNAVVGAAPGRASACIFRDRDRVLVLRHYHRGGWAASLSRDHYLWTGLETTRAWREWRLLAALHGSGLPVPRPVAARVLRHGLVYSADLVTEYLPGALPLADLLMRDALPATSWREIGRVIRRFHAHGVHHPDLNARNVLVCPDGAVYLIDFDKGYQDDVNSGSRRDKLARLQRSLRKFSANEAVFFFDDAAWNGLLAGYREEH